MLATGFGEPADGDRARARGRARASSTAARPPRRRGGPSAAGADGVIAQGADSGGHTGIVPTFALVPQVVDAAGEVPVLAAGGVADGRGARGGARARRRRRPARHAPRRLARVGRARRLQARDRRGGRRGLDRDGHLRDRLARPARAGAAERDDRGVGARAGAAGAPARPAARDHRAPAARHGELELPRWFVDTPNAGDEGAVGEMALYAGPAAGLDRRGPPAAEIVRRLAAEADEAWAALDDEDGRFAVMDDLPPAERTLPALLERQAAAFAERTYLSVGGTSRTYRRDARRGRAYGGKLRRGRRRPGRPGRDHVREPPRATRRVVRLRLARREPGADQHRDARAQLQHVLGNSGPRALAVEQGLFQHLDVIESLPLELERIWLLGGSGVEPWRGLPVEPSPSPATLCRPRRWRRTRPSRFSIRPARPARRRGSCARRPSSTGGRVSTAAFSAG